ncbi:AraC family transcriptional regulator [Paucibacter soli]|uniref:AraC family transcriptional regulator n=1 Tax=Paucibacter soli TaxID=3133433 RepID=UPI0030A5493C
MTLQATVSLDWVHTVLAAAARLGVPSEAVLAAARIPAAELAAQQRWPIDQVTRLWRAAVQCTQDPGFGLKAGAQVGPASFAVLGEALRASASLREAIALVQKYQRLISDGARLQIIAGGQSSWVVYHPRQGTLAYSPHQIEAVLAAVVSFARAVTGRQGGRTLLRPLKLQFNQPAIGPLAAYQQLFRCPVAFDQAFSGVLFDNALLDAPLPQADAQQSHAQRRLAAARLAELSSPAQLSQELRRWIAAQLQQGRLPARAQAAQALALSPRTLARRMAAAEPPLDFSRLLDEARRDAALQAVARSAQPLAEIGQLLGFAEPSTFWRAFRRWTGSTPGAWREQRRKRP